MADKKVRVRFAPSPTGPLHIGGVRTALYNYLFARHNGGDFLLRIEDTDQNRYVPGAEEYIINSLKWCGLVPDEGPGSLGGDYGPYRQSERMHLYKKYTQQLLDEGKAYEQDGAVFFKVLPGKHIHFHDEVYGDIDVESENASVNQDGTIKDIVIMKRDGMPTYNFANVIDDHLMGITHVVRGSEYLSSAPKYNLLYEGFGWEVPTYVHCSPVMRDAQHKMSKRNGDPSYEDLKAQGYLTPAILNYVALLGWSPRGEQSEQEFFTLDELVGAFDIGGISKSPAIFDIEKLTYFNANYLRNLPPEEFCKVAEPYIRQAVKNEAYSVGEIAALLQARCEKLTDIPEKVDFFDALPEYGVEFYTNKKSKTNSEVSLDMLNKVLPKLESLPAWTNDAIHDMLVSFAEELGVKNATLMWPLRIAVAGKLVTPGGAVEICHILGREETIKRVKAGIAKLA